MQPTGRSSITLKIQLLGSMRAIAAMTKPANVRVNMVAPWMTGELHLPMRLCLVRDYTDISTKKPNLAQRSTKYGAIYPEILPKRSLKRYVLLVLMNLFMVCLECPSHSPPTET